MADKKKTNKRKLSTLVKQQVPEFVLSENPKFAEVVQKHGIKFIGPSADLIRKMGNKIEAKNARHAY